MRIKWTEHSQELDPLREGERVYVQNQAGLRGNKWDNVGVVRRVMGNRQYEVTLDKTGRTTVRNRRFLRPCPVSRSRERGAELVDTEPMVVRRSTRIKRIPSRFFPGENR